MQTNITLERKQKIKGPDRLILELDADEIYPDDPGMGTPVLVSIPSDFDRVFASFECAVNELEIEGFTLTDAQINWLNDIEYAVNTWLSTHSKIAQSQLDKA